ncbi:MAG: 50S ribosomal protein L22 [Chlamydiia bacterium]|nr:50S ribosomal protein L22 [Chlamydiia bacterium]MCH9616554.1 50S ribosomal protein L22 [Chlamydiia bacterium]MCH9629284.1 50S ribosomal protein L22 [Chlamydiia bacterium]
MPSAKAITKYVRISPKKARPIAQVIRGMMAEAALSELQFNNTKGGRHLYKTLHSAVANAESLHACRRGDLKVQEVRVDNGPSWKRAKSKARGGKVPILKRQSHFTVVVGTEEN